MKATRREFVRLVTTVAAAPGYPLLAAQTDQVGSTEAGRSLDLDYGSAFFRVQMAADQPGFHAFAVDSLGKKKLEGNMMLPLAPREQ